MTEIRLEKSLPSEQERVGQPASRLGARTLPLRQGRVDPLPYRLKANRRTSPALAVRAWKNRILRRRWEPLLARPRTEGRGVHHVPFCETHCTLRFSTTRQPPRRSGIRRQQQVRSCACGGPRTQADESRGRSRRARQRCEIGWKGVCRADETVEACLRGQGTKPLSRCRALTRRSEQAMGASIASTLIRQLQLCEAMIRAPKCGSHLRLCTNDGTLAGGCATADRSSSPTA